jgi:hypothetical protein
MLINYSALTILFAFLFASAFAIWAWRTNAKSAQRPAVIALLVTVAALGVFLVGSTELLVTPFIDISAVSILGQFSAPALALLTVAAGFFVAVLMRSRGKKSGQINVSVAATWLSVVAVLGLILLIALDAAGFVQPVEEMEAPQSTDEAVPSEDPRSHVEIAVDSLPAGFELGAVLPEESIERPTTLTMDDDGYIYVATFFGGIFKISPPPWDSEEDLVVPFAPELPQITGMVFVDGSLYANGSGSLFKLTDTDGDGSVDTTEALIEGLPSRIYDHHSNNGLTFGADGRFYFGLGGTTDHGPELDELAGNILVYDPSDESLSVYAFGLRNSYDQAFCPSDSTDLYVTDNAPDKLDETMRFIPPDELNFVEPGKNYGYPVDFGYPAPFADSVAPMALMETAGVPTGLICYEPRDGKSDFPAEYHQDLFVALAGGSNPATGHKIVRIQIEQQNGRTVGIVSDFLIGLGRPVDLIEYLDGSLLILDYDLGQIYQVVYAGN